MLFRSIAYIQYLLSSTNHHGLHSPFVYELVTKCFHDTSKVKDFEIVKSYRQLLNENHAIIRVIDFGVGSKKLKGANRKVSSIIRTAGINAKRAKLLYRLTRYFNCNQILEIGTSLGMATATLALSSPEGTITSLEGCPETAQVAHQQFEKFNLTNIQLIIGQFDETLSKALDNQIFDLIYFDGNHQKEATLRYFEQCLAHNHNDSLFIFDDIYWSKGMSEAWNSIKNHPKVTVSIDTFQWGLVFFRKEQQKQHFTLRI